MTELIAGLGSRVWQTEAALNHYRLSMPMTVIKDSILDLLSDPIKGRRTVLFLRACNLEQSTLNCSFEGRVHTLELRTKDGSLKDDEM